VNGGSTCVADYLKGPNIFCLSRLACGEEQRRKPLHQIDLAGTSNISLQISSVPELNDTEHF
jgi:hypothetical protein